MTGTKHSTQYVDAMCTISNFFSSLTKHYILNSLKHKLEWREEQIQLYGNLFKSATFTGIVWRTAEASLSVILYLSMAPNQSDNPKLQLNHM